MRSYYRFNNLGKVIEASGHSVAEVSHYTNISPQSIYRYIAGKSVPNIKIALRIAKCLDANIYDIYDRPLAVVNLYKLKKWQSIGVCRDDSPYNNIEDFMWAKGFTPKTLAFRAGIKERVMYGYLSDKTIPNVMDAISIANVLGVTVYQLFDKPFFI